MIDELTLVRKALQLLDKSISTIMARDRLSKLCIENEGEEEGEQLDG